MNAATATAILKNQSVAALVLDDGEGAGCAVATLADGRTVKLLPIAGGGCTVGIVRVDGSSYLRAVEGTAEARAWLDAALEADGYPPTF